MYNRNFCLFQEFLSFSCPINRPHSACWLKSHHTNGSEIKIFCQKFMRLKVIMYRAKNISWIKLMSSFIRSQYGLIYMRVKYWNVMANLEQLDSSKAFDNTTHWVFLKKNYIQLKRINGCRIYFDREHIVVNLGCYLSCLFVVKVPLY